MEQKNKNGSLGREPSLKDLIDIGEWQKIQNSFSAISGMCIRTVDTNGLALTTPSSEPKLCKLVKKTRLRKDICGTCLPTFMGGYAEVDKNLSFSCKQGLHQFMVPLKSANDKIVCYIIFGPVILVMRKTKEEYREIAEELNVDLDEFWNAILEIRVISFNRVQSTIELVKTIGEYILKLACRHITIEEEIKEIVRPDSKQLNNLFNMFLEVAVQISGADIGSVMLLDESMKELTIRSSYGLPEEVARNTRIKLGEGLSGLAAKEDRLILISEKPEDSRIKYYLERPYIASSVVIPIKLREKVLGVINLAVLQSSSVRFDADNAKMINKLAELTTLALQAPVSR